ncbi:uncharacterized protein N7529_011093 [Penicillium soppii]|uniref:uncharacterized protein n=1 Tax=Penicillium soppii TaxID=69789 RepID=UPI002548CA7F|nr:uncharacterized protein N7529_011093 [Penicillium soppii]KAJ5851708.1 hypothetical protein N7529_011093 [Penicillium soppii]
MSSEENHGATWDDVEMQDETQPICLMAGDCSEFFEKCLSHPSHSTQRALPPEVIQFLQEFKDRFDAWASFLGVFAGTDACLDYRLRRHPALQDV